MHVANGGVTLGGRGYRRIPAKGVETEQLVTGVRLMLLYSDMYYTLFKYVLLQKPVSTPESGSGVAPAYQVLVVIRWIE